MIGNECRLVEIISVASRLLNEMCAGNLKGEYTNVGEDAVMEVLIKLLNISRELYSIEMILKKDSKNA